MSLMFVESPLQMMDYGTFCDTFFFRGLRDPKQNCHSASQNSIFEETEHSVKASDKALRNCHVVRKIVQSCGMFFVL